MDIIHNDKLFHLIVALGIVFAIMAAIAAYINAYEGYSHFPNISMSKKIRLSLSIAFGAFCIIFAGIVIAGFLLK